MLCLMTKKRKFLKSESRQQTLLILVMFADDFVTIVCKLECSVCKGKVLIGQVGVPEWTVVL